MLVLKIITWVGAFGGSLNLLHSAWWQYKCRRDVCKITAALAIYWNILILVVLFSQLSVFNLWWMALLAIFLLPFVPFYNKYWSTILIAIIFSGVVVSIAFLLN